MRKIFAVTAVLFLFRSQAYCDMWTLPKYLGEAFKVSDNIKRSEEELELSKSGYVSSLASFYLPNAAISASNSPYSVFNEPKWRLSNDKTSAGASLSLNLFNNFKDKLGLDSSRLGKKDSEYRLWREKQSVTIDSLKTYYNVLRTKRLLEVVRASLKSYEEQYGKVREYYREGMKSYSDVLKSELNYRASQLNEATSSAGYKNSMMDFNLSLYREPEIEIELEDVVDYSTAALPGLAEDLVYASKNHIEIKLAENALKRREIAKTGAFIGYLPDFSVDAAYNRRGLGGFGKPDSSAVNPTYSLTMSLSLPVGPGTFTDRKNYLASEIELRRAGRELYNLGLSIRKAAISSYLAFSTTLKRYEVSKMKAEISRQNLEIVAKKYGEGGAGIIELADAQNDDLSSQSDLANASYDLLLARADYEKAAGRQLWK
jgi:outer membrane protein TolC